MQQKAVRNPAEQNIELQHRINPEGGRGGLVRGLEHGRRILDIIAPPACPSFLCRFPMFLKPFICTNRIRHSPATNFSCSAESSPRILPRSASDVRQCFAHCLEAKWVRWKILI